MLTFRQYETEYMTIYDDSVWAEEGDWISMGCAEFNWFICGCPYCYEPYNEEIIPVPKPKLYDWIIELFT